MTIDDARAVVAPLPRSYEAVVRDRVKFRVGSIVYAAFSRDETTMGFAFPREEREALVASEPDKFLMPEPADMRYRWVQVRLDAIDVDELRELLVDAWRMCVPKKVAAGTPAASTPTLPDVAHPRMFDDDDPYLARVRALALALPDAAEKVSHGRPAFFTKKVFAYYGGSLKVDGEWVQHFQSVVVLPDAEERPALVDDPRVYVPAYLGPSGWLGIDLDEATDWDEVGELLDASFRSTAPRKAVEALDTTT